MRRTYPSMEYLIEHQNEPYFEVDDGYIPANDLTGTWKARPHHTAKRTHQSGQKGGISCQVQAAR